MLLTLLAWLTLAQADCTSGSLSVWPPAGSTVPSQVELVLQAYGTDRARLAGLRPDDLALVRGDDRIALRVVADLHGSFQDDQRVLTPERAPEAGIWTLQLGGEPLALWNGKAHEAVSWTFAAVPAVAPAWTGKPAIGATARHHFGCGPGVSVSIAAPVRDAVWLEATVRGPGATTTVRLPIADGAVDLGHGMCSGLVELEQDARYSVELVPVGADGRRAAPAGPLPFTAP